jgi:hypothetical protein
MEDWSRIFDRSESICEKDLPLNIRSKVFLTSGTINLRIHLSGNLASISLVRLAKQDPLIDQEGPNMETA